MIGIHVHTNPDKAAAYFQEHLMNDNAASDYYSQNQQTPGHWFGKGAERLGLTGEANMEQFKRLCHNLHPATGLRLTVRNAPNARSGYDFVISAPKSVSIMALVLDDPRILEAHEAAVKEVLHEVEALAMVRVRVNGADEDRPTGNITGAAFTHFTAREQCDPQCHTHCHIHNVSFDDVEKRHKALQAVQMFAQSGLMSEVYRNRLVALLHEMGYPTRDTRQAFEIDGVTRDIINTFSKGHKKIDDAATAAGAPNSKALRAAIAKNIRKAKDTSLTLPELREKWLSQLSEDQIAELRAVKAAAVKPVPPVGKVTIAQALELAALHLFERRSSRKPWPSVAASMICTPSPGTSKRTRPTSSSASGASPPPPFSMPKT